jgi:hypothetical protein
VWVNEPYALGAPDGDEATLVFASNTDNLGLGAFDITGAYGAITQVELVIYMRELSDFQGVAQQADILSITPYLNNATYTPFGQTIPFQLDPTYFTQSAPADYVYVNDITGNRTWAWSDFSADYAEILISGNKGNQSPPAELGIDAVAYRVTTDRTCGSNDDIIATLPLTDTYDADLLQFVSSNPVQTTATTSGTSPNTEGTITWDNLGPLYGGESTTVQVTFLALDPGAVSATTVNTATVTGAKFGSGRDANDGEDTASVTINRTAVIGDYIWFDADGAGDQDATEYGWPGITVRLCDNSTCSATIYETTTTDATGYYEFVAVDGTYFVVVTPPGGATNTADPDGGADSYSQVNVAGVDNLSQDFGYDINNAMVRGIVWEDNNGDGDQDPGENGFAGEVVQFCIAGSNCNGGNDLGTSTVQSDGSYVSPLLPVNTSVEIRVATPAGGPWTHNYETDGSTDGTITISTPSGGGMYPTSQDFGYRRTPASSAIGDTIYVDWNGDGTQDSGEEGIQNVIVYLYEDANGDGLVDLDNDALIISATTTITGFYQFTNVPADDYIVLVDSDTIPTGHFQTADPGQSGTCGICDHKDALNVDGTSSYLDEDFGYQPRGSSTIGDYVWEDTNGDGVQGSNESGLSGILVTLYEDSNASGTIDANDAVVYTTTTDTDGAYLFENLPFGRFLVDVDTTDSDLPTDAYGNRYLLTTGNDPQLVVLNASNPNDLTADFGFGAPGVIGDFIWADYDGDGLADTNEPGINGVTVQLYNDVNNNGAYDSGTDTLYGSQTTANNSLGEPGYYLFSGIPAGNYLIRVDGTQATLTNYTLSADPDVFNDTYPDSVSCLTSGAQGCDGIKPYDRYGSGETNDENPAIHAGSVELTADFGYQPDAYVGDFIWIDSDADGVRDPDEQGISDITVSFCEVSDCSSGTVITTTTDENGEYGFGGGMNDNTTYYVVVDGTDSDWPASLTQTYDPVNGNNCNTGTCTTAPSVYIDLDRTDGVVSSIGGNSCSAGTNCNLDMDFGYRYYGTNSINGVAWHDSDSGGQSSGIGDIDAGETIGYNNVPVYLWNCGTDATCGNSDDTLVGSTNTSALTVIDGYIDIDDDGITSGDTGDDATALLGVDVIDGQLDLDGDGTIDTDGSDDGTYCGYTVTNGLLDLNGGGVDSTDDGNLNGIYQFTNLADGTYRVVINSTANALRGTSPTTTTSYDGVPASDPAVTFSGGNSVATRDFGFLSGADMGDLPSSYNLTLMGVNGPRHTIPSDTSLAVYLGSAVPDAEPDGQESTDAGGTISSGNGDDNDIATGDFDDDEGVVPTAGLAWVNGADGASITLTGVSSTCTVAVPCYLSAWVDWNEDGSFSASERVLVDAEVNTGTSTLTFDVPTNTFGGSSNLQFNTRFRLFRESTGGTAQPTGTVDNGEVEDHQWNFAPNAVTLVDFSADSNPMEMRLAIVTVLLLIGAGIFFALKDRKQKAAIRIRRDKS